MQTRIFIPLLLLLLPLSGHAQAWKWAQSLGSANSNTTVNSIRPYSGTSVLVSGSFAAETLTLGSYTLENAGQDDGYVAIAGEAGQYVWAAGFGGSGREQVVDAAAAPDGSVVVAGNFTSISMTIGETNLFNSGETDAFVAKYEQDKTLAWVQKIGTADIDEITHVVVDAEGNAYVSGHVLDKFTHSTLHVFIRKLDAAGNPIWEQKGNMQGGILQASALTLDGDQAVYLGGSLYGTATFGSTPLTSDTSFSAFIVKYNPSGAISDIYLNPALGKINGLQAQGDHVFACAEKLSMWCFGWGWPLSDSRTHVLKFDTNLENVWHKTAGGDSACLSLDLAKSLSVDNDGNVYLTGYFFSDTLGFAGEEFLNPYNPEYYYPQIFVFKYSPTGEEIWGRSMGGIHSDEATSILAIGDDTFYLAGNFESDPATFGSLNLHNTGKLDSIYVHLMPPRFARKTMGFLALFDKNASNTMPEPGIKEVVLFPNPAGDQITLRLKEPAASPLTLQLFTADGRLLRQTKYPDGITELREDVSGLPPGVFFVTLKMEGGVFTSKVVKQE